MGVLKTSTYTCVRPRRHLEIGPSHRRWIRHFARSIAYSIEKSPKICSRARWNHQSEVLYPTLWNPLESVRIETPVWGSIGERHDAPRVAAGGLALYAPTHAVSSRRIHSGALSRGA